MKVKKQEYTGKMVKDFLPGECFILEQAGSVFMRLNPDDYLNDTFASIKETVKGHLLAVDVSTGVAELIPSDDMALPVKAEITVVIGEPDFK